MTSNSKIPKGNTDHKVIKRQSEYLVLSAVIDPTQVMRDLPKHRFASGLLLTTEALDTRLPKYRNPRRFRGR